MLQYLRKSMQIFVFIIFLVAFPILSLYNNALSMYAPSIGGLLSYQAVYPELNVTPNSFAWSLIKAVDWIWGVLSLPLDPFINNFIQFKGTPWSITLFGYTISDPLAVISVLFADKSASWALISGAILPIVLAVLFGKIFCGWICPMHTLLEINLKLRKYLLKKKFPIRNFSFSRYWKFVILIIGFVMALLEIQLFAYILPYLQLGRSSFYWFFYGSFYLGLILILLIVFFELFISERGWCRYFCPSGAFLQFLSKYKMLKIVHNSDICIQGCKICSRACDLGLDAKEKINEECSNCGNCISACPQNALSFRFGNDEIDDRQFL